MKSQSKIARLAHNSVNKAIRAGQLTREPCEICGEPNHSPRRWGLTSTVAHHDDYANPLLVRWLCPPCHQKHHRDVATFLQRHTEWFFEDPPEAKAPIVAVREPKALK